MGAIAVKKLVHKFGETVVLDEFTETFYDGELYVLMGASGSGKTTLLKDIAGLGFMPGGKIEVNGQSIYKFSQKKMLDYHMHSGFVFQNSALIGNMSIRENLTLYYQYHTAMPDEEIMPILNRFLHYVGFADDLNARPNALSTGEKMLINIVRAISHDPEYLFWDSPLANLDPIYGRKVKNIITDLKKKKKTMILVTNDAEFAFSVADTIGIIQNGRIVDRGTPDEIRRSTVDITQRLIG
jgi:phospholipid/cholesterol/gamma-HCH transport system ATP-binding protein